MEVEKAQRIARLVADLNDAQNAYDRCEFFRDNYKYVSIKVETTAPRSGHYFLDVGEDTVRELFNKRLNDLSSEISQLKSRIESVGSF